MRRKRRPGRRRRQHGGPPPKKTGIRRPPRQLNPRTQRELKRANGLMRKGEHANAAQVFIRLAEHSQDRGILRPSGRLFVQAAMAMMMANQIQDSQEQARKGLLLLAANGHWPDFVFEGNRLLESYDAIGETEAAKSIATLLAERESKSKGLSEIVSNSANKLPTKCPYCGASLSLQQIQSGGEKATECKYCGSIVLPKESAKI